MDYKELLEKVLNFLANSDYNTQKNFFMDFKESLLAMRKAEIERLKEQHKELEAVLRQHADDTDFIQNGHMNLAAELKAPPIRRDQY